jgi:hypothetical protein
MKFISISMIVLTSLVFCTDSFANEEGQQQVKTAFKVCDVLEATGLVNECDVSGFSKSISFRVDVNAAEGRKICAQVSNMEGNYIFRNEWTIKIYSPFSGDHVLASCAL